MLTTAVYITFPLNVAEQSIKLYSPLGQLRQKIIKYNKINVLMI